MFIYIYIKIKKKVDHTVLCLFKITGISEPSIVIEESTQVLQDLEYDDLYVPIAF